MPKVNCDSCGAKTEVPEMYLERRVRCPKCRSEFVASLKPRPNAQSRDPSATAVSPPSTSQLVLPEVQRVVGNGSKQPGQERMPSNPRARILTLVALPFVAVVSVCVYMAIHPTGEKKANSWDAENRATIVSLSNEAEDLAKNNKPDEALAKFDQLFAVVSDHKPSDADLQQKLTTAQAAMTKVKRDSIKLKIRLLADQQLAIAAMKRAAIVMRANLPDKTGNDAVQTQQMISDNDRDLSQAVSDFQSTWQKLKPVLDTDSATVISVAQEIIHDPTTTDEQAACIKGLFRLE